MSERGNSAAEAREIAQRVPPAQGDTMRGVPFEACERVRIGFIGLGGRGEWQLNEMLSVEGAEVIALSDPVDEHALQAQRRVEKAGRPSPVMEADWRQLCERDDIDLVYICSRWDDHVPQSLWAMECGKHAAVEVPAATTLADCWRLVDTSERTRRHCIMLENCCYGQLEMMILRMVREGIFGELTHGEAAYIHEMRGGLLADSSEGLWRRVPHTHRNGNLYPTHGLGPVAQYMDILTGDRFIRQVAMSSREASLTAYRDAHVPPDSPKRSEVYVCGDMNTSLIQTARGRTILLQHDVVTPRPYSRANLIAGTQGTFSDYPPRIFLDAGAATEGIADINAHDWSNIEAFLERYEHPLWRIQGDLARKLGGHGGMDFIMNYRLIQCIREGLPPDMDVYDAATWSAPGPLSEMSVTWDSLALPFPDFTRGRWQGDIPTR